MPTLFESKVWILLKKIPKGKVTTYKTLGKKLKSKAYRAIGTACSKNPYAPKVPCHRVVKTDGKIGQYAKGTKRKIELLRKEGISITNNKVRNFDSVLWK
jgi:methylated-DNA-[protein]-cysteine S-methyltransferase